MLRTEGVIKMWNLIKPLADNLDIRLREEHRWSSADICFVESIQEKLDGLGPIGIKPQNKTEFIIRHSLLERAALLAMTLLEFSKKT